MEYLIVDGYNIINSWSDIFNLKKEPLEDCRYKLLEMLSNYQGYKNVEVIVVFDAHMVKRGVEKQENHGGISVVYTRENETADSYIERFVYKMGRENRVRVATSDYAEQRMILSSGGIRMSPRELKDEIGAAPGKTGTNYGKPPGKTNTIMANVDSELLERLEKMRRGKIYTATS